MARRKPKKRPHTATGIPGLHLVGAKHRNHTVLVSRLSPEAQKRLREIKQDDLDELTSLRLSGRERVWGIRESGIFHLLWWDPEHRVFPTTRQHT